MTLRHLQLAVAMELRLPLGGRRIVTLDEYRSMPEFALAGVLAVPLTRRQLIRRRLWATKEEA